MCKQWATVFLTFVLAACGHVLTMTSPPPGWPTLKVIDHGADGTLANCSRYSNLFTWPPLGCAVVDFERGVCDVWAMAEWVKAEELKHCAGQDHAYETTLADAWTRYLETHRRATQ